MIEWLRSPADRLPDTRHALPSSADAPGLLAAGGELTPTRLTEAYSKGVFPWYSPGQPILWWAPDPRMVLLPEAFRMTKSMRKTLARFVQSPVCEVRIDSAFRSVITACATSLRDGEAGTWIVPDMIEAYCEWHEFGRVHSIETWIDGELVGGLYGVSLGRMFFGESMFSRRSDASKIALAALVCFCRSHCIETIDCQQKTSHLASMGAREMPREAFEERLSKAITSPPVLEWFYDLKMWNQLSTNGSEMADIGT